MGGPECRLRLGVGPECRVWWLFPLVRNPSRNEVLTAEEVAGEAYPQVEA